MNQEHELLSALKKLWQINDNSLDNEALELIRKQNSHAPDAESFEIQQKVLLKTREKTEALLKRVEFLEQQMK